MPFSSGAKQQDSTADSPVSCITIIRESALEEATSCSYYFVVRLFSFVVDSIKKQVFRFHVNAKRFLIKARAHSSHHKIYKLIIKRAEVINWFF